MATAKKAPAKKAPAKKAAPCQEGSSREEGSSEEAAPPRRLLRPRRQLPRRRPLRPRKPLRKRRPAKKRTANAAFMKALTPSAALAAVVGNSPLPRTEVVSKLWTYIKKNKLQDAVNKRMINADAKLKEVFGKAQVSMFEMAGLIGKHLK
jgi:upstream activation factor subunit UAF30